MVGTGTFVSSGTLFLLVIMILYLATRSRGAQSITANRDTRRSNSMSTRNRRSIRFILHIIKY